MKLSAPVYHLKRKAKALSRVAEIPLHAALDHVAKEEGFEQWSLLASKLSAATSAAGLFARLFPGDLVLIGARPRQGKTLMSLELAVEAMKSGHRSVFFSLEYTQKDIRERFRAIGAELSQFGDLFAFDSSDALSAGHIVKALDAAPRGTLAVIDYLQLLDQKREHPDLMAQVRQLKGFAEERGLILVFISQIDRSYDPAQKPYPDAGDVRLPNPLDLSLFNKACFLNKGEVRFSEAL